MPTTYTSGFSQEKVVEQYQEFIEIFNDNVTWGLITDQSNTQACLAVMMADDRMQTVDTRRTDLTGLRFPGGGIGQ